MKYTEFKDQQSKKYGDFKKFFAFSDKQLEEGMEKIGATDIKELASIGMGGFILKKDTVDYLKLLSELREEQKEFLEVDEQLKDAFIYELGNHEFCITYDYTDTLSALNFTFEELTEKQLDILAQAKKEYLEQCEYY